MKLPTMIPMISLTIHITRIITRFHVYTSAWTYAVGGAFGEASVKTVLTGVPTTFVADVAAAVTG
jgi:hypothetical protein